MLEKVLKVIDEIEKSDLNEKISDVKKKIESDETVKKLIKKFNDAKELYEKTNDQKTFMNAKEELLSNDLVKKYIDLQNEVNLLALHINNRIKMITSGIPKKR